MRAYWALEELGLAYETRPILPRTPGMQDAAFLAVSGRGKVPILQEDDRVVGESAAIVLYLADRYRDAEIRLSPEPGAPERGRFNDLCLFCATELDATSLYVIRRHEGLPDVYGASTVACEAAREYFLRQAGELERKLADGRAWLMGDAFSGADILLVSCIDWASVLGLPLPDALTAHRERAAQRPPYQKAMQINFTPLAELARSS